jgi:hypothetical protein
MNSSASEILHPVVRVLFHCYLNVVNDGEDGGGGSKILPLVSHKI